MAEALAFGTLVSEANHVRLSGQDVEKGTFSHRHAVIHDQNTGKTWTPLKHVFSNQDPICSASPTVLWQSTTSSASIWAAPWRTPMPHPLASTVW